jgi:hypothetical protein
MPTIQILHNALALNWPHASKIFSPKTLVLGSFNPHNLANQIPVDYYYGRTPNHFWQSVARARQFNNNHFFTGKKLFRKLRTMHERFCLMDVIDSVDVISNDQPTLMNFISTKINTGFNDNVIFTTNTNFNGYPIKIKRNYNQSILPFLTGCPTIRHVVHTMGTKRLWQKGRPTDLENFIRPIKNYCDAQNIRFINLSLSPSGYAISNGNTPVNSLDNWVRKYLHL